ncbi:MAG: bifunctional diguanylate cyclase/phosphodiesterase [Pseudomonadota bacterium]
MTKRSIEKETLSERRDVAPSGRAPSAEALALGLGAQHSAVYEFTPGEEPVRWSTGAAAALGVEPGALPRDVGALRDFWYDRSGAPRAAYLDELAGGAADAPRAKNFVLHTLSADGESLLLEERIMVRDGGDGDLCDCAVVGMLTNHTLRERMNESGDSLRELDPLTGRLSRSALQRTLDRAVAAAKGREDSVGYVVVGVDRIARINDAYGFQGADEAIAGVGRRLCEALRAEDVIGRIGGAKFGILLSECSEAGLARAANRIRDAVRRRMFETSAGRIAATVSVGSVSAPFQVKTADAAMAAGEEALARAKASGSDGYAQFVEDEATRVARQRALALADQLLTALDDGRVEIALQPVVRANDPGRTVFLECLVRMIDRDGVSVPAGDFMPIAEKLGLVRLIDKRVLELAGALLIQDPQLRLSVNLSTQSALDPSWLDAFRRIASDPARPADRMIVEITESTAMDDPERIAALMRSLRTLGAAVAIDDFGAGYTSFSQLRDLRPDIVKIDGSFVQGLPDNPDNQVFVRALLSIARQFEMTTVAEFADDEATAALLLEFGADCLQGSRFGRPQSPDEALNRVACV